VKRDKYEAEKEVRKADTENQRRMLEKK